MLTYIGKGYTPGFTVNYDRVAERLNAGEEIEIVSGPDDICAPLLEDAAAHCHGASAVMRDEIALASVGRLLERHLCPGSRIVADATHLRRLREAFKAGSLRTACSGCEWHTLCDTVSNAGFCDARITQLSIGDVQLGPL